MASKPLLAALALAGTALAAPAPAAPAAPADGVYRFGPGTEVSYRLVHKLHRVTGRTGALEGELRMQGGKPVLPATLKVPLSTLSSGNANRDANARNALGVLRFPEAELTLRQVFLGGAEGRAEGTLALRGEARPLAFPFSLAPEGPGYRLKAAFPVSLTAYGIPRPALVFVPVEDEVEVSVDALALPQP